MPRAQLWAFWANITQLDLSRNLIFSLQGIEALPSLEDLNLSYNKLESLEELERVSQKDGLRKLKVSCNPLTNDPNYSMKILHTFPGLKFLDATTIDFELHGKTRLFESFYLELSRVIVPFLAVLE